MEPEKATEIVFGQVEHVYELLKKQLVLATRSQGRRVGFAKTVSDVTRKMPVPERRRSLLGLPPTAFHAVSAGLANSVLCGFEKGLYEFLAGNSEALYSEFRECISSLESSGRPHTRSFITNELANAVASSIVTKALSPKLTQTGRVIFVHGSRGSGKTTLVFWSLYTVLSMLGVGDRVLDIIESLWVNTIEDYLRLQKVAAELAKEGGALPFIVVEDAGTILSKYMMTPFARREERRLAFSVSKMEHVAREGVCAIIYLAHPESVIKGLRQLADLQVDGFFHDYPPRRHTMWVARSRSGVRDVFATIHPSLKIPDELMKKWFMKKLETRLKLIEEVETIIKEVKGEGGEQGADNPA